MLRLKNLNPYERHKLLINEYILNYPGATKHLQRDTSKDKRDIDVIRENHKFLWDEDEEPVDTWEKQLAKKYYDKLFKEYCISDLSRYKENKVALRWRTEKEVISGKGQFICGNKICNKTSELRSWEVNFAYMEDCEKKNALIKLRLCPDCSRRLNYHSKKREVKRNKDKLKNKQKKKSKSKDKSKESGEASTDEDQSKDEQDQINNTEMINSNTEKEQLLAQLIAQTEENSKHIWANLKPEEFAEFLDDLLL